MPAKFFEKYEYELLMFLYLTVKLIFLPQYLGHVLPFLSAAALNAFIALLLGKVIRSAEENSRKTVLIFTAFFLGSSVSNTALFLNSFEVASTVYLNIFVVFCLLVAFTSAPRRGEGWHIPLICFVCTVFQPLFALIYLPVITIFLLYEFFSRGSTESKWVLAASAAVSAAAIAFVRKSLVFSDQLDLMPSIRSGLRKSAFCLAVVLPLFIIFTFIWINAARACKDNKMKLIFVLILLEPVFPLFALLLKNGIMNAVMVAMFAQFCFFAYFLYVKDKAFLAAFGRTVLFFEKNLFAAVLILIYLSAFSFFRYNQLIVNRIAY